MPKTPATCPHYNSQSAEVAKVGRKYPDRDPLRGSPWRLYLKDLARSLLLVLAVMMISAVVVGLMTRT